MPLPLPVQLIAGVIEQRFLDVVFARYMPVRTLGSAIGIKARASAHARM